MNYLECNSIKDYVKGEIVNKLEALKGWREKHYISELGFALFESENINGAYFCCNYSAREWISKYFEDLGEIVEEINSEFDSEYANKILLDVFDNPDRFVVVIVLEVARYLISCCETVIKYWDDEITLTDDILNKLIEEIKTI